MFIQNVRKHNAWLYSKANPSMMSDPDGVERCSTPDGVGFLLLVLFFKRVTPTGSGECLVHPLPFALS
jgi:hypothetical protein